ncbi:hypothetical protein ACIOJD_13460 [Streptomyces sp. NPDC088116]
MATLQGRADAGARTVGSPVAIMGDHAFWRAAPPTSSTIEDAPGE